MNFSFGLRASIFVSVALAATSACSSRDDSVEDARGGGGGGGAPGVAPENTCATTNPRTSAAGECSAKGFMCGESSCILEGKSVSFACGTCSPDKECVVNECVVRQSGPPPGSEFPSDVDDQGDLGGVDGDPALDIIASQSFVSAGAPWVRVRFAGAWPPAGLDTYRVRVALLGAGRSALAQVTASFSNGSGTFSSDGIATDDTVFVAEAKGFRLLFDAATLQPIDYSVTSFVRKTAGGTEVSDESGPFPFSQTAIDF